MGISSIDLFPYKFPLGVLVYNLRKVWMLFVE